MAIFRFSSGDGAGFSLLFSLAFLYGSMSILVYSIIHMKFIQPLGADSPLDRFSEARAMEHLRVLSKDIDGRQVGRQGYRQAADYIKGQLQSLKERVNPNFRIEELADEAIFWGGFGFYATLTLVYVLLGLSIGFVTFFVTVSLLVAWGTHRLLKGHGTPSLRSVVIYVLPFTPCLTYTVHFGGFLVQFLIEKMGMVGSPPSPYGYYIQDIIVAAIVGVATSWSVGPILPIVSHWLARSSIIKFLLQVSVVTMAISSQLFPYSTEAPKRVVLQHTVLTSDSTKILDSTYDFSVVDSNSLSFLFKNSPKAAELLFDSEVSFKSTREEWLPSYPISYLFSKSMKFPTSSNDILSEYKAFPRLSAIKPQEVSDGGTRRVYLELDLGSLKEVSVAVLNITGPLHKWSLVDVVPAPETIDGGPPSHICRLSGSSHEKWNFWLEANGSDPLRVDVAVLDQHLVKKTRKLKGSFPDWVDVTAYTSFMSTYLF